MGKKRTWIDFSNPDIEVPTLDASNLPVEDLSNQKPIKLADSNPSVDEPTYQPEGPTARESYLFPTSWRNEYEEAHLKQPRLIGSGQPVWDEESMMAEIQPGVEKFGKGFISRGASLVPKLAQNIGHIAGAVQYGMDYMQDPASADPNVIWGNAFVGAMGDLDEDLREALPIYKSHLGREGKLLDQMKDPAFWFDDFFDSLAFLGSAYLTGAGIGAASKAAGLGKYLAGSKAAPEAAKLMSQKVQVYGATLLNSIGEAGFEAKDFQDTEKQKMAMRMYDKPFEMLDPEQQAEIKGYTSLGASNVFKGNLGVLIVPNYIQSKFMFGKIGQVASEMRAGVRAGTLASKDISLWGEAAKAVGTGIVSEGLWEEGMQHALQTYNSRRENFGEGLDSYITGVATDWVDNFTTVEGQKNMVLGSIVGGLFGGFGGVKSGMQERAQIQEEEGLYSWLKGEMGRYDKWYIEHITTPYKKYKSSVQKTNEDGQVVNEEIESFLNDKGETEIDIDKAERMFLYTLHNKLLFDEGMAASVNADNIHLETVNKDALARRYFNYATNPAMTNLDEVDQLFMERELSIPKELQDQGYTNRYTEADIAPIRQAYETAINQMMDAEDFSASQTKRDFKLLAAKTLFGEQVKRDMYEGYLENDNISEKQKEDIRKLIKDSERLTKKLLEKKTRERLYGDYLSEMDMMYDARNKLAELQKDPNAKKADIDRALYEQQEYFYINGTKSPFSTQFSQRGSVIGPETASEFGARFNYFHDIGKNYWRKAKTNEAINDANKGKKPILDVVNQIVKDVQEGTEYSQEEMTRLENSINQRQQYLNRTAKQVAERQAKVDAAASEQFIQPVDEDGLPAGDPVLNPAYDAKLVERDQRWLANREMLRLDYERASITFKDLLQNMPAKPDRTQMRDQKKSYRKFQRDYADLPVEKTDDILKSYNGNKNAYDNTTEIDEALSDLEERKKIYSMPGRKKLLTTNEFKRYVDSIDQAIGQLKSIRETVAENRENRKAIDIKSRRNYSTSLFNAIGIKIDRENKTHVPTSDRRVYDTIAKIIGIDVFNSILEEARVGENDGVDYSYDAIYVEKIINLVKETKEGIKTLNGVLDQVSKDMIGNFIDSYNGLDAKKSQAKGSQMDLDYYKQNPEGVFGELLDVILNRYKDPIGKISVIDEYLRDKDIFKLYDAIQKGSPIHYTTISKKELLDLLEKHIAILGVDKLRQRLASKTSLGDMIETENAVLRGEKLAPSNQQLIALREAVEQLSIALAVKESAKPYRGWFYLKGLAGTGKTTIFARWLMKLLKLSPEAIVGLSTHENALKVLQENLEGVKNTGLVESFDYSVLSNEDIKIVMVDEVARLNLEELNTLADKVAQANETRKIPLRVYVFGDPSQVSSREESFPAITNYYFDRIHIRQLNPLTSVFRSGNSAIIRAQNIFLDMPGKVKTFLGIASADILSAAEGVHVSNIKGDLKGQVIVHQRSNEKTRVVVVSNLQDAAYYSDLGIPVMQYYEVAGLQYDEVYIDIDPKDFEVFGKAVDRKYNEAMYTATSRSKTYLFIKSYEPQGNWKYRVDKITKEDNSERNKEGLTNYTNRLEHEANVLGLDVKTMRVASPQILKPTEVDEKEVIEPQTEQEPAAEEAMSVANIPDTGGTFTDDNIDESVHELEYPSYSPIKNRDMQSDPTPFVRKGSRVKYIKVWNPNKKNFEVWAVAQHINIDGTPLAGNVWEQVGVLSNNELLTTAFGRMLMQNSEKAMSGTKHLSNSLSNGTIGTLKIEDGPTILAEGTIRKAAPLSYEYSDDIQEQGVGFLRDLISKVKGIFSSPTEEGLEFTVEMYSTTDDKLTPGVPYLIIKRKTVKDGEEHGRREQFIRLAARKIKTEDHIIKAVRDFYGAILAFEQLSIGRLSEPVVNEFLKRFNLNFEIVDNKVVPKALNVFDFAKYSEQQKERNFPLMNEDTFNEVLKLSKIIIPGFYGVGEKRVEVDNQFMMEEYIGEAELLNPEVSYEFKKHPNKDGGYILRKSKVNEQDIEYVSEDGLQAGKGSAQIALNVIAKANTNESWAIKKRISVWRSGKQRNTYITQAKHLLSENNSLTTYFYHILELYRSVQKELEDAGFETYNYSHFINKDSKRLSDEDNVARVEEILLEAKEMGSNVEGISAEEFKRLREEHRVGTITSEQLGEILSFDKDGTSTLNLPLKMNGPFGLNELGKDLNQNINQLEELLGSKLKGINKTRIQVDLDKTTSKKAVDKPKTVGSKIDNVLNKIQKRGSRLMRFNPATDLGREISLLQGRELLAKFVPAVTAEGKDVLRFMDQLMLNNFAGERAYGLYRDEVIYAMQKGTGTFTKIIRHEAFHKIFNEYLTKTEQNLIVAAFKKQFPQHIGKSKTQIEELIAEAFQNYQRKKLSNVNNILKDFFNWLAKTFGFINMNMASLDRFFETIEGGYFVNKKNSGIGITAAMKDIVRLYGYGSKSFSHALDIYRNARAIVQDEFYALQTDGFEGFPITRREIKSITEQNIVRDYIDLLNEYDKAKNPKNNYTEDQVEALAKEVGYYKAVTENYDRIVKDIYQNWNFDVPGEIVVDTELSTEEIMELYAEDANRVNSKEHIIESDEVNQESKMSMAVKDFLSNIKLSNGKFMGWREAYIRTLQMFEGIQPDSTEFMKQLDQSWENNGKEPRSYSIVQYLQELYADSTRINYGEKGTNIPNTMKFVNEDLFTFADTDISDVAGPIGAEQAGGITIKRNSNESTREFIIRISEENGLDVNDVIGHFQKYLKLNTFRSLVNLFNNQKQKNIFIVEKEWLSAGTYSISYIPGSYVGPHLSVGSQLSKNLIDKFDSKETLEKWMKSWLKPNQAKFISKQSSNKIEFIRAFLKEMRMGQLANSIPNVNANLIYNHIIGFFTRAKETMGKEMDLPQESMEAEDVVLGTVTMTDILDKEKKMVIALAKLMSISSANMRATNVRDVVKKRKYIWSPASFAHNVLFNMINNSLLKGGRVSLSLPSYLKTDYFKKNIFLSGKNRIYDVIDHDGIRSIGFKDTTRGIKQTGENAQDFIVRTFIAGFLDRIRYSSEGKETYFQMFYPNERPNAFGAEVGVLTLKEVRDSIRDAIVQLNGAPQLPGIRNHNQNKYINFRLLENVIGKRDIVDKPFTSAEMDKLADKVMKELYKEAQKAAKTIVDNRVPFDNETFKLAGIERILGEDIDMNQFKNATLYGKGSLRSISNQEYNITEEQILPLVYAYVANNYINSYFLNQIILGDNNQFTNEEDVMRRFSLATAPGFKPLVNKIFGMPEKVKFLVIGDEFKETTDIQSILKEILTPEEQEKLPLLMEGFKDNFALGDGQGFMLPERYEQLRNSGFASEFSLHRIVKPVVYSIGADGVVRGVKYSAVVLSDELVAEFPSLGKLRTNIRRAGAMEAVFGTGVKIGMPQATASFSDMLTDDYMDPDKAATMSFDVLNDHYRIQLDPKAEIESTVRQPSQLMYLASVLEENLGIARRLYYHMSEIERLGSEKFFEQFGNKGKIQRNITSLLRGKGNERAYDILSSGLSINFPSISDKVVIQLASRLEKLLVDIDFPGTKLVLQSEYAVRKYNQTVEEGPSGKLKYIRTKDNRLVAEVILPKGLLPKEYEDQITTALADKKNAKDYFDLPDLLGFRIPSSDIHSGIAMKVVGFYSTPDVNVIIAPDLLVALHGSDFDVDSLFVIKRSLDTQGNIAGYEKKHGRMAFMRDITHFEDKWESVEDTIAYRKNGILHELLDMISNERNVMNMLSPIPLRAIQDQKKRVLNPNYHPRKKKLDLSNYNDQIESQETIFGASIATGIFGNAAKGLAYMLRTAKDGKMPSLRNSDSAITIDGKVYDTLSVFDDVDQSLFVSIDGFINAAIDNIRELALPILNINLKTIKGFIALRALGVPLETVVDILQQPSILELTRKGNYEVVHKMIQDKLGGTIHEKLDQTEISAANLATGIQQGTGIEDMAPAVRDSGTFNAAAYKALIFQAHILEEFKKMNGSFNYNSSGIGNQIGKLAMWLKIARSTPNNMIDVGKSLNAAEDIFGIIEDDGTLPNFDKSTFPFDISQFFIKNPHILQAHKSIKKFSELISSSIKKHDPAFEALVDKVYNMIDGMNTSIEDSREIIRNEIITYLLSNEVYSGSYKVDKNTVFEYQYGGETRILTGPKAMNQIFIGKIDALKNYLANKIDAEGFPVTNMFLSFLHSRYNGITRTYDLVFDGGPNMDPMDQLDIRKAFIDLNRYEVKWNKKTGKYKVTENESPRADNEYSEFQNEFVSYGIMNWGLQFGSSNYSMVLPEDMYLKADVLFNSLMDKFIGDQSEENWKKIEEDFMIQFMINNGNLMQDIYFKEGLPLDSGVRYENEYGKSRTFYGGRTDGFFYDRAYANADRKMFKRFIITKYENRRTVYMRMNDPNAEVVYYQRIDTVSPFKYYNTSDEVLSGGYKSEEHFQKDKFYNKPIFNMPVGDLNKNTFTYYGEDLKEGDVVSFTLHHDVTRLNKAYKRIVSQRGSTYVVESIIPTKLKSSYHKTLTAAEIIVADVRKAVFKKGTPFRSDNKGRGRIMYHRYKTAEARTYRNKMNSEQYEGFRVWRERLWADGIEMYLDNTELVRFLTRGTEGRIDQFYKSNNIKAEDRRAVEESKTILLERTVEDDALEQEVKTATDVYSREKDVSSMIDSMIARSRSKRRIKLLTALKSKILQQDFKIRFGELNKVGLYGQWQPDGTIVIDLVNLYEQEGRLEIDRIDRILFHEMLHGITKLGMLEDKGFSADIILLIKDHFNIDPITGKLSEKPHTAKVIGEYLKNNGYDPEMNAGFFETFYGLSDVYEFISEILANDEFASIMNDIKKAGEQRTFLQRVLDKIMEFIGLAKEFSYDFLQIILNSPYTPSFTKEGAYYRSSTGKLYGDLGQAFEVDVEPAVATNVDEVRRQVMERVNEIRTRSGRVAIDKDAKGEELATYSVIDTGKKLKRITDRVGGFISFFTNTKYDPNVSFGQHKADLRWGKTPHDHQFETEEGNMETYEQYKNRIEKQARQGMIKGNIMHLMFMRVANKIYKLGYNEADIIKKMNDIASLSEGVTKPEHYNWLEDPAILAKIFDQAGINALKMSKDFPESLRDIIYLPEQTVWSDLLGFGGTMDALIAHADGRWSIKDWKTGRKFGSRTSTDAMKYGLQDIYITDNQRERAKLQVMLYAFLLKLEYPDMQFRDLMTVWIPDRFLAEREDMERFVEVSSYLGMIKAFLNDKQALKDAGLDPNVLQTILKKSPRIFDVSEYSDKAGDSLFENLKDSAFRPEEEYRRRVMEIQIILNRFIPGGQRKIRVDELPDRDKKRLARLYEEIAIIRADPSLQLDVYPQGDIGWISQWLGNYSDVNMGVFQTWVKIRNERWNSYTQKHEQDILQLNRLVEPIYNEYMKGKVKIRRGGIDRIANVNYAELFGWAYKQFEKGGVKQERLLVEGDNEWSALNSDKKKLLTFLNNKYAAWFVGEKAYLNQQATVMFGKSYSWLDLYNLNRNEDIKMKHYLGWFPKTMKTYEEINYEQGAKMLNRSVGEGDIMGANILGRFSAERIKEAAKRQLTWFTENEFEMYNDETMALPIKYLDNPVIINDRNYTKNLVFMFDRFNKSMLHKQHMDSVYVTGQALKTFLELKRHGNGQPMFENTIGFLEKKLIGDIQNRSVEMKYTRIPVTIGKYNISIDKIIEGMLNWTSMTIMWLRPMQGTGNALFAKLLTYRESIKGSIAGKFLHINGNAIDFTMEDNVFADGVYFGSFLKDSMIGDIRKNKMWLLARKLNYLPDNYDYATDRRFLLSTRNQAMSKSNMYVFHSKGEEYVSLTTMVAQLHHLKNPVTGKTLWDSYEVRTDENGVTDVHWIGGTRGYEKAGKGGVSSYAPITELTGHEIAKLKKVHERMQGGYRKEEAANIEIYVMGKAFIQFKKYVMRLLMNALGGKRSEVDLGNYEKINETRIDPKTGKEIDVYEWLARVNEGRWRTLANVLLTAARMGNPEYRWSTLSSEQKQNIVDAILAIGMLGIFYSAYILMFEDDKEDDTFKKWWKMYMIQNVSQQYNPMELLKTMETVARPVSLARAYKFTEAFANMMIASGNAAVGNKDKAFTQQGDLRGWNEFQRSIPYVASWHDLSLKLSNASETEQWWTNLMVNKWR